MADPTKDQPVTSSINDIVSKYKDVPLTEREAEILLTRSVNSIVDRISDLESENRRLGIMLHFVKSELASIREKERKELLKRKGEEEEYRRKEYKNVTTQEPEVIYQSRKAGSSSKTAEEEEGADDDIVLLSDDWNVNMITIGRMFDELSDPRGQQKDVFDQVQRRVLKRLSKRWTKKNKSNKTN